MRTEAIHLGTALASAFDFAIAEARAELAEHEEHAADAAARLDNLLKIRAAMNAPPASEQQQ